MDQVSIQPKCEWSFVQREALRPLHFGGRLRSLQPPHLSMDLKPKSHQLFESFMLSRPPRLGIANGLGVAALDTLVSNEIGDGTVEGLLQSPLVPSKPGRPMAKFKAGMPLHYLRQLGANSQQKYLLVRVVPFWAGSASIPDPMVPASIFFWCKWPQFNSTILTIFFRIYRTAKFLQLVEGAC